MCVVGVSQVIINLIITLIIITESPLEVSI
jgi:hypothetical protein